MPDEGMSPGGGARPPDLVQLPGGRPQLTRETEGLFQTVISEVMAKLGPTDYFSQEWRTGDGFKVQLTITHESYNK